MINSLKFLPLVILIFCISPAYNQELLPDDKNALLVILVVDYDEVPIEKAEIHVSGSNCGISVNLLTNAMGLCEILVPAGQRYIIDVGQVSQADIVHIPDEPEFIMDLKMIINRQFAVMSVAENINITIAGVTRAPVLEKFEILSLTDQQVHIAQTDADGNAKILLPPGQDYQVNFEDAKNFMRFSVPYEPDHFLNIDIEYDGSGKGNMYPTLDKILVGFHYYDLDSTDVADEKIKIQGLDRGTEFEVTTDETGWAWILIPRGDRYHFSTEMLRVFQRMSVPATEELEERIIEINFVSSLEYRKRLAQLEEQKELFSFLDSLKLTRVNAAATRVHDMRNRTRGLLPEKRFEVINKMADRDRKKIDNDFTYFIKEHQEVNAVFHRFMNEWKDKVIVIDVTCSMDPYTDQVLSWMAMQLSENQRCQFIFFNDGDGKSQKEKITGATGGFHYSGSTDIDSVLSTLYYAESFGCSGDAPENDLEALLYSLRYMNNNSELILVADNTSAVRDIELLKQLKVPVRVILCGFDAMIHPEYLEIAYHTDGSIHTIEEDIMDLRATVDKDELIRIHNIIYHYRYGRFVPAVR